MDRITTLPPIPPRPPESHKGTFGRVLIASGSRGMAGAAVLASRAALRAGAGLVTAVVPESLSAVLAVGVPEATQWLLPEVDGDESKLLAETLDAPGSRRFDAVAVGPGLGTGPTTDALVAWVLKQAIPQVVDADALNAIAGSGGVDAKPAEPRVWTPHPGEFLRLTGESPQGDTQRLEASERFVGRFGGVIVLKGHRTVIMDRGRYRINETGHPGMATGGSGDVLTGVIAALLGQGFAPFDAAGLGAHLHGMAGDIARETVGEVALIANDLTEALPRAILEYQRGPSS